VTQAIVLVNDRIANRRYDLLAALRRARRARVVAVVEPASEPVAPPRPAGSADGDGVAAAAAATFGAPVALGRFLVQRPGETGGGQAVYAEETVASLLQRAGSVPVFVGVVSLATLPLWEALHADARTQAALKIGITSPRLDADWNLAQKLVADGKLQLHEHSATIERMLARHLDTLLAGHTSRGVPGAAGN
jgi:hypothetical protein